MSREPEKILQLPKAGEETQDCREILDFLNNLYENDGCLPDLEQTLETDGHLCKAPAYLKEQILERSQSPEVVFTQTVKKTSKRTQLFFYGLKTAAAVGVALLLLSTVSKVNTYLPPEQPSPVRESPSFSQHLGDRLREKNDKAAGYLYQFSNLFMRGDD